jgi:dTMP kinase
MSLFITFEGWEGCGKSSQARALYNRLLKLGIPALLTHEPGGTPLGNSLRRWLKGKGDIEPKTELLLFNASRAHLVSRVILPTLQDGVVVISDRFADSTVAYQGYGRGLALDLIAAINKIGTQGLRPDLTVLLDLPVEQGLARKRSNDRFEREDLAFHRRVRQGYLELVKREPERWLVIDATLPKREVGHLTWGRLELLLQAKSLPGQSTATPHVNTPPI